MSRQRIAASRALVILQNLSSDCSDNDDSDIEIDPVVNAALASVPGVESADSHSDDEADDQVTHSVVQGGPGLIQGRDGSKWRKIAESSAAQGHLQYHNILRFQPGSTAYFTNRVDTDSPVSSFRILFDEPMLRNIKKTQLKKDKCELVIRLRTCLCMN